MKNNFTYLFILFLIACNKEEPESEIQYFEPEGKLQSKISCYDLDCNQPIGGTIFFYNKDSNIIRKNVYLGTIKDINLVAYHSLCYDNGKLISDLRYFRHNRDYDFKPVSITTYYYEFDRLIKTRNQIYSDSTNSELNISYFEINDIDLVVKNSENKYIDSLFYKDNKLIEQRIWEREVLFRHYKYEYESNKLIKKIFMDSYFKISNKTGIEEEYFYNEDGQLEKVKIFDPWFGFAFKQIILYDYY
ncbi:MAG: hypothetical protein ACOCWM_00925 [Cyclobacteriaceae bacterium]